ncbi:MAG TPA: protein kinase [Gemmatimonadaceae bacterium]|nr:protein kinase [Gemmatimonadaceae bacterium]
MDLSTAANQTPAPPTAAGAGIPDALRAALAGRYEMERQLGRGGMATVYLARDVRHGRLVAVKVMRPELAASLGAERFLREIKIAAQLQHPHILTLIDSGEAVESTGGARFLYYVMPYVQGESLRSLIERRGPMAPPDAVRILRDVVDALACAHRHGIVHRDVKPENVMVAEQHALVVDFGVAKAMTDALETAAERLTGTGIALGTPSHMAPEQAAGDVIDHRTDIYAVGVLAYEMLTGKTPFVGSPSVVLTAQLTTAPRRPSELLGVEVPPALERVVMRCLETDPANRYQTTDELLAAVESLAPGTDAAAAARARRARILGAGAALAAVALAAWLVAARRQAGRERWVHEQAVPAVQRLADGGNYDSAFVLARQAAAILPRDPVLTSLWPRFTRLRSFVTTPAGATVSRARFDDTTHWELLGTTPLDSVRVPFTVERYRIEKAGYRPMLLLTGGIPGVTSPELPKLLRLDRADAPNPEMARIPGGLFGGEVSGLTSIQPIELRDFLIDRYEITNAQYKAFVDAGGYAKREYWDQEFVKDGRRLDWREAMALFVDRTGRPGPATWEAGGVPRGEDSLPVGGVSWYEAAAYAKFAGKSLPTVYHWVRAAGTNTAPYVTPGSNFGTSGPVRGGSFRGMGPWGVFDMAGNVREWCLNADGEGKRYIQGGGWSDPPYMFTDAYAQLPFDRSAINGIRLAKYPADEPNLVVASLPIVRAFRDYWKERPASDALFATYREMYDYDRTPLDPKVEARDTTPPDWVREKVSFAAAYGGERVLAYLYLPKRHRPPYQTIVFFPGSNALHTRAYDDLWGQTFPFLITSGRALVVPILESTYERSDGYNNDSPNETIAYRDHMVMWGKDLRRTVDYLSTRPDVDSTRLAYFGTSWGGRLGGTMLAIEPRFRAAVLHVAGLRFERARPEADPINFLPRITTPVLMLNGKYDHFFPVETSQKPYFSLLGTPPDKKKYLLYEGGHSVPRRELVSESLNWLDEYLGKP